MKRMLLALALVLGCAVFAWYLRPDWFKDPLVQANRSMSGLTHRTVVVAGHKIHYLEGGKGEHVVLLHGIFSEKDHWVDFARHLTGKYHVIIPDLPAYGDSTRHEGMTYDYAAQSAMLRQFFDALDVKRAHIAGNSMGGTIATLHAIEHPDRVQSVALIDAPHGIRSPKQSVMDREIDQGRAPLVARTSEEFQTMLELVFVDRPFLPYPILHDAQTKALARAASNQRLWQQQLSNRYLLEGRIDGLQKPLLALWGDGDRIFDVSGVQRLQARLPSAQVQVLPGIGHLPMMEAPRRTAEAYADFLAKAVRQSPKSPD